MELSDIIDAENYLNRHSYYYDLIYKDLDGTWKQVNAAHHLQKKIVSMEEILEFLELFRRGREEWNLKLAIFTEDINVVVIEED
jgi:hypothetical protein